MKKRILIVPDVFASEKTYAALVESLPNPDAVEVFDYGRNNHDSHVTETLSLLSLILKITNTSKIVLVAHGYGCQILLSSLETLSEETFEKIARVVLLSPILGNSRLLFQGPLAWMGYAATSLKGRSFMIHFNTFKRMMGYGLTEEAVTSLYKSMRPTSPRILMSVFFGLARMADMRQITNRMKERGVLIVAAGGSKNVFTKAKTLHEVLYGDITATRYSAAPKKTFEGEGHYSYLINEVKIKEIITWITTEGKYLSPPPRGHVPMQNL